LAAQKAAILAQVGHFYFGEVGQYYFGANTAKHAVIGLTRSTAREYIADGIRINAVCPGITDTSRRERRTAHLDESEILKLKVEVAREIPIGRVASADEIAQAILWLSSPSSSYVVGHSLVIDGGLTA
jgi:NAD(P)-dependent dehydrogenase (short-subunit alcohol dehydrogenase family)